MSKIAVQNITVDYTERNRSFTALKDVCFEVQAGEFVSVIGPSGSGKSTLMNIIGCLDTADDGQYLLDGTPIDDYSENTIVEICTKGEDRLIHYFGYGYYAHEDGKPYRFLEYTWFIAPLEEALKMGLHEYESENCDQYKTYIEDCTEEECVEFYEHYDNGKTPKLIYVDEVDMNTPDGVYILIERTAS